MRALQRRGPLTLGVVVATVLAVAAVVVVRDRGDGDGETGGGTGRPNIVVIMTDDQTLASMAVLPKVRRLIGEQGATFANTFVSFPLCCPSRATYLTGQYAHNHRVIGNLPPHGGYGAFKQQETTFPAALQRAGYDTIHIGKYLNGYGHPPLRVPPGWNDFRGSIDPSTYLYRGFSLNVNGHVKKYDKRVSEYQTDVYADLAAQVIRGRKAKRSPFFLNVAFLAPHVQGGERSGPKEAANAGAAVPAPRHVGRFADRVLPEPPSFDEEDVSDKPGFVQAMPRLTPAIRADMTGSYRAYLESLLAVDDAVQGIIGALREIDQLDKTVVVFTSDNGFFGGEHRIPSGKVRFYEPSIRVPLLIRGPGIPKGVTRRSIVGNVDLAPTILDLAGVEPLRAMDGRSLIPTLSEEETTEPRDILLESGGPFAMDRGVRNERYLYVEYHTGERELYDLSTDPDELTNRAADPALTTVRAELARRLSVLRDCTATSCRTD